MGLSCECGDDYAWYGAPEDEYRPLSTKRARRCMSCNELIHVGDLSIRFYCYRSAENDIEERIHGDEVPMANRYYCERCADLYWSLIELGFCMNLNDDMRENVKTYAELYGKKKVAA